MARRLTPPPHPMQPLVLTKTGVRFKDNAIVRYLLEFARARQCGLNELVAMPFATEDWTQFVQLIGYSLEGVGELTYIDPRLYKHARKHLARMRRRLHRHLTPADACKNTGAL